MSYQDIKARVAALGGAWQTPNRDQARQAVADRAELMVLVEEISFITNAAGETKASMAYALDRIASLVKVQS